MDHRVCWTTWLLGRAYRVAGRLVGGEPTGSSSSVYRDGRAVGAGLKTVVYVISTRNG